MKEEFDYEMTDAAGGADEEDVFALPGKPPHATVFLLILATAALL